MIVIPASLRSDFIHIAGMTIHIALESTIHIVGIRRQALEPTLTSEPICAGARIAIRQHDGQREVILPSRLT